MSTIKDVAKLAGVSISTVSLALNNQENVKEATRKKVLDAVKKLNYRPNRIAQGLAKNKTNNISFIMSSGLKYGFFSNPVLFEVIKGITEVVNSSGYHLILSGTTNEEAFDFIRDQVESRSWDGMILWGTKLDSRQINDLSDGLVPSVCIGRYSAGKDSYAVNSDDFKGGLLGVRHLLELGHRKIGFIGEVPGSMAAGNRLSGYTKALEEYGVSLDKNLIVSADFFQESGYKAMQQLLPFYRQGMSAVFAASDLMALGAMEAILASGLSVPGDISVVGFDNMPNSHLLIVPLTTVAMPLRRMGEEAAKKLLGLMTGHEVENETILDVELVVRSSTKSLDLRR